MPGEKGHLVADGEFDSLLASTDYQSMTVIIDSATVDTANDVTTELRKGLVLGKVTASGKYKEFNSALADGTEDEEDAVILLQDVTMDGSNDEVATVLLRATLKSDGIIFKNGTSESAFDWSAVQRFIRV